MTTTQLIVLCTSIVISGTMGHDEAVAFVVFIVCVSILGFTVGWSIGGG